MKDSGVPWLGQVPEHWEINSLWQVSQLRTQRNPGGLSLLSVFLDRGVIPYGEGGGQVHAPSLDLSNYQVVRNGDFVLNNQQAWRGSVGVSELDGIISPAYIVLKLSARLSPRFANYLFRNPLMVGQFVTASKGVGDIQRQLYWPYLKNVRTILPSPQEQLAIVRFLDHADRRIRKAIAAKQKLIKLLQEQKQVIIHQAVTRGLDPNVKLKPSGVEWLGDVPEGWNVVPAKWLFREVDHRSVSGEEVLLSLRMYQGLVPHTSVSDIPITASSLVGYKKIKPGQIVMNRMRAAIGMFGLANEHGLVSPDYAVFDVAPKVVPSYFLKLFKTKAAGDVFRVESKGLGTGSSGFMRLYTDRFGRIGLPLPPSAEQRAIVTSLEESTRDFDLTISRSQHEIDLLREYRTRLIADVVTGKLDVRDAAARLPELTDEVLPDELDADVDGDEVEGDGTEAEGAEV